MDGGNWEFWLNMTNFALGAITLFAVLLVFGAIGWELLERKARRTREAKSVDAELSALLNTESHSQFVPGLGVTMADGGRRIESSESSSSTEKKSRK